jgi:thiosulfate/3-mercaptopyruvate sulfurtransferase
MSQYAHPEVLVDTQWLADHLSDTNLRIVEVDVSPELHKDAHIPCAVFWNIFTDLLLPNLRINLEPTAMEKLLSRSGITPETMVIAYGSNPSAGAWIFWLLKMFGHDNIRVLNGGYQKWIAEGRSVSSLSNFEQTDYQVKAVNSNLRILPEEVQSSLSKTNRVLLDVRTFQEYSGEWFYDQPPEANQRTGHIPNAVHIDHLKTLNEDGTFKSFDELQTLYSSQGITAEKEIIPYCTIGARSGYVWFVLKYLLGYPNVRNYDGSWSEWSQIPDAAIEK